LKIGETVSVLGDLPPESRVLIIRLRSLGDLVLETPAIAALHSWRPDLKIYLLIEPRFVPVFEGNAAVSGLIASRNLLKTAAELRRHHFPIVFNQHGGPRSALLTVACRSPLRVGWKGFQFSAAYNVAVPDAKEFYGTAVVHAVEHRISQFYWTGLPRGPIPRAQLFPQRQASESVRRALSEHGIQPGAAYAVVQPGARLPGMRWPAKRFAQLARWLREQHGMASVVNLSPADAVPAGEVQSAMRDVAVIPQPFSISELIALVAEARIFIGNDSGPAHIAAATKRPAVVIYGPTNPAQWHPWHSRYRAVHTGAVFKPGRGDKSLAEHESRPIRSIELEEVSNACEELLKANGAET
jgi:ADP-heptose:LPS heptosyltransferase